jgi:hypothetical protein
MAMTSEQSSVYNIILGGLRSLFTSPQDQDLINTLAKFIESQILADIPEDEIAINLRNLQAYKDRFRGNEALKSAGLAPLSEAEYLSQERTYLEVMRSYGLGGLANRDNFAKMIGGSVSPAELQDRIVNVYDRINNADTALANELRTLRNSFGINNSDWVSALLLGQEGADSLKKKISQAEIRAEATVRGLSSAMGDVELQRLGVSRQQAAQGFETIKNISGTLGKLAGIYGEETEGLQKELEQEQFTGLQSKRRKQLTRKEVAQFSGRSGSLTGQQVKNSAGNI